MNACQTQPSSPRLLLNLWPNLHLRQSRKRRAKKTARKMSLLKPLHPLRRKARRSLTESRLKQRLLPRLKSKKSRMILIQTMRTRHLRKLMTKLSMFEVLPNSTESIELTVKDSYQFSA